MQILKKGCDPDSFFKRLKAAKKRVLLLDYDGTLAPFSPDRSRAFPYPGVREMLGRILREGHCRLVLISGRSVEDLIPLLELDELPEIWGSHGLERLKADGRYRGPNLKAAHSRGLSEAAASLREQTSEDWREGLEKKPAALAFHWRGVRGEQARRRAGKLRRCWEPLAAEYGLLLHDFDGGVELKAPGADKGVAVQSVLAEEGEGALAAFLGDDLTDEDAFYAVCARGGLSVLVRPELRPTCADLWIKPPRELLRFLADWLSACT